MLPLFFAYLRDDFCQILSAYATIRDTPRFFTFAILIPLMPPLFILFLYMLFAALKRSVCRSVLLLCRLALTRLFFFADMLLPPAGV